MSQPYPQRSVFASAFTYSYTKLRGKKWVVEAMISGEGFPGAETAGELRAAMNGEELTLYEDGQTLLVRARCIAAGEFLHTKSADVWVTFDDDAFVPRKTLRALIDAARATRSLVGAPAINRLSTGAPNYSVEGGPWSAERIRQEGDLKLYPVHNVSTTCVAIHRHVIESLAWPQYMVTHDKDHKPYPALFLERIYQGAWLGDDYSFCLLMHEHFLRRYILLEHPMTHAGIGCMVSAEGEVFLDSATAKKIEEQAQGGSK